MKNPHFQLTANTSDRKKKNIAHRLIENNTLKQTSVQNVFKISLTALSAGNMELFADQLPNTKKTKDVT